MHKLRSNIDRVQGQDMLFTCFSPWTKYKPQIWNKPPFWIWAIKFNANLGILLHQTSKLESCFYKLFSTSESLY